MIKRSVVSMLGGAALAALFLFSPAVNTAAAYCQGYCEAIAGYSYAGCQIYLGANDKVEVVACGYIGSPTQ